MAEIDELSIGIEAEAPKAAKTIDSLVGKLDILVKHLSAVATTPVKINIDTNALKNINTLKFAVEKALNNKGIGGLGKNMESVSAKMESLKKDMDGVAKSIEEPIKKAASSLSDLSEKYKDLGKGFQFFGDEKQLQSQLQKYRNLLEKTKLGEEKLRLGGDEGSAKYEKVVADLMQYSNIVERISEQLSEISTANIGEIKMQGAVADKDGVSESIDKTVEKLKWYNDYLAEFSERVSSVTAGSPIIGTAVIEDVLSRLKKEIPDAVDLIESYEAEIERLNDIKVEIKGIASPKTDLKIFDKTGDDIQEKIDGLLKKFRDIGTDFDFSGSQKELEKIIDSTEAKLIKLYERQDKAISLGKTDTSSFESLQYDIAKANNELDRMKEILKGMQGTREIKINLLNQSTVKALEDFEDAFQRYKEIVESGGIESESGAYMPISGITMSLEQLREQFPEAISLIRQFEELLSSINKTGSLEQIWEGAEIPESLSGSIDNIRERTGEAFKGIKENVSTLSNDMMKFMESLDDLEIPEIKENNLIKLQKMLKKAESDLEKLRVKLENGITMGKITEDPGSKGFRNIQEQIAIAEKTVDSLKRKIESVGEGTKEPIDFADRLGNLRVPEIRTNSFEKLQKMLEKAEADLDKLKAKLENDITMGRITTDFEDSGYRKAVEQIALTEKKIEYIKEKMKTADSSAGKTGGYDKLGKSVSKLAEPFRKLEVALGKAVSAIRKFASSAKRLILSGIRGIGNEAKKSVSGISALVKAMQGMQKSGKGTEKTLADNIKTMLKYSLSIRSVFMLIRKMKDAFRDGMNNLVQYSAEVNHSVSLMTSGLLSLKNGLAVAFSPIVSVVAPYIDMFVDMILSAVNAIGRFFAALTGKTVATQAKKVYQDCAESVNGVADSAKDAAKAIGTIGIDELNILSENKADSGGTGGGAGIEDMFEDVAIEKDISDWAKRIREAFLAEDWEELGKTLAELVNRGLQKIYGGITGIIPKVEQALKNFAAVFNSFVEYLDWELLGKTIGAGINLITTSVNALLGDDGIDFENLGAKLSVGFRGMIDEIDWTGLGNAIGNWFMVSWRIADGFITDMWRVSADTMRNGWEELGIAVGEAVNGVFDRVNFEQIARVLTDGFRGIIEAIASALETIKFDVIAEKINAGLAALASSLSWESVGKQITRFTAAISKAFNDLLALDFGLVGEIIGNGITAIVMAFNQLTGESGINFELLGANIADGLRNLFTSIPWEEFGNALGNGFMVGWRILDGFISGMAQQSGAGLTGWEEVGISIGTAINGIFEKIDFGAIGTLLSDAFNGLIDVIRNVIATIKWDEIAANLTQGLNNFIHGVNWAEAGATLSDLVMKLLNVFWQVAQDTDWESLGRSIGEFLSSIDWKGIIGRVFDILWTVFSECISGLFDTKAGKVIIAFTVGLTALTGVFNLVDIASNAYRWITLASDTLSGLKGLIMKKVVPGVSEAIANIAGEGGLFSKLVSGAKKAFTGTEILKKIGTVIFSPKGLLIAGIIAGVALIVSNWDEIKEAAKNLWENVLVPFGNFIKDVFTAIWEDYLSPALSYLSETILPPLAEIFSNLWNKILVPLGKFVADVFGPVFKVLGEVIKFLVDAVVVPAAKILTDVFGAAFQAVADVVGDLGDVLGGVIDFITGVFTGNWEKAWDGVVNIFRGAFNLIPSIAEGVINAAIGIINGIIDGINVVIDIVPGDVIPNIPKIPKVSLPRFATGGFPEDGLFLANHNELVGQFTNGQTAVANNAQIVEGIKYGVREAVAEALIPYLADIAQNTRETADKDMSVRITDRDIVSSYNRGTTRQGFSFTS